MPAHQHQSDPPPVWRVGPSGATGVAPAAEAGPQPEAVSLDAALLRRRQFLRGGFWTGIGVLAAGGVAILGDFLNASPPQRFGGIITVLPGNVPRPGGAPSYDKTGRFWLVNLKPGEGVPQLEESSEASAQGGVLALYEKCTHLGFCRVPWRPDFVFLGRTGWFRCPCHGATYTKGGVRVFGPAPRSLDTFPITDVSHRGVSVNTGRILLGDLRDPQRAVVPHPFG